MLAFLPKSTKSFWKSWGIMQRHAACLPLHIVCIGGRALSALLGMGTTRKSTGFAQNSTLLCMRKNRICPLAALALTATPAMIGYGRRVI